jgi:hypothetical protein
MQLVDGIESCGLGVEFVGPSVDPERTKDILARLTSNGFFPALRMVRDYVGKGGSLPAVASKVEVDQLYDANIPDPNEKFMYYLKSGKTINMYAALIILIHDDGFYPMMHQLNFPFFPIEGAGAPEVFDWLQETLDWGSPFYNIKVAEKEKAKAKEKADAAGSVGSSPKPASTTSGYKFNLDSYSDSDVDMSDAGSHNDSSSNAGSDNEKGSKAGSASDNKSNASSSKQGSKTSKAGSNNEAEPEDDAPSVASISSKASSSSLVSEYDTNMDVDTEDAKTKKCDPPDTRSDTDKIRDFVNDKSGEQLVIFKKLCLSWDGQYPTETVDYNVEHDALLNDARSAIEAATAGDTTQRLPTESLSQS